MGPVAPRPAVPATSSRGEEGGAHWPRPMAVGDARANRARLSRSSPGYRPAQRATSGVYLSPAAAPVGKASSSRDSSSGEISISVAAAFSSR